MPVVKGRVARAALVGITNEILLGKVDVEVGIVAGELVFCLQGSDHAERPAVSPPPLVVGRRDVAAAVDVCQVKVSPEAAAEPSKPTAGATRQARRNTMSLRNRFIARRPSNSSQSWVWVLFQHAMPAASFVAAQPAESPRRLRGREIGSANREDREEKRAQRHRGRPTPARLSGTNQTLPPGELPRVFRGIEVTP